MIENVYPLSPLQEGLYYHWLSNPGTAGYFMQMSYQLQGRLQVALLEESYSRLVNRHAVLRTFFTQDFGEQSLQVVRKDVPSTFSYIDVSHDAQFDREAFKAADRSRGFDLHSGSQMRLTILREDSEVYEFIWSHHHILMDGWCVGILIREFFQIYHSLEQHIEPVLRPIYPYAGYIEWLMKVDKSHSLQYWQQYLSGFDTITGIPKLPAADKNTFIAREKRFELDALTQNAIRGLCMQQGVTESTFFQTVWSILLSKYNNTGDIVFGAIVSGRPVEVEGIEEMIGFFINTIPVRVQVKDDLSFAGLLKVVQQEAIGGLEHHYTQLAQIQQESGLGGALFDHILQFQNLPVQEVVEENMKQAADGETLSLLSSGFIGDNTYDFTCIVVPGEKVAFRIKYNGALYASATLDQLEIHLRNVLAQVLADPAIGIASIHYLGAAEQQSILDNYCYASVDYPANASVVSLFYEQAQRTPDAVAVIAGNRSLTYRTLDEQSDRLAAYLVTTAGIVANDAVGVLLERGENMIVAILGIMKAGGAYVAIDPEYPDARKKYILEDTNAKALVTQTEFIFQLGFYTGHLFAIDIQLEAKPDKNFTRVDINPGTLAYIIYTSGSTGQPKGVMISHRAVIDYTFGILDRTNMRECKKFGLVSTIAADLGNTVIYPSLLTGGALHIFSRDEVNDATAMRAAQIDCLKIVPSHWKALQQEHALFAPARCLVFGGEQLTADVLDRLRNFKASCRVYNHYGPTETTVGKLINPIDLHRDNEIITLGRPFGNASVYLLHAQGQMAGIGITGEICIGGDGVSAGYLNQPALTAEKFVPDPFRAGARLYRTGDLGQRLSNGEIVFLGRKDDQVKIRGYRTEPGEIARRLQQFPGINTAIVLPWKNADGEKELVAYVATGEPLEVPQLQQFLLRDLPAYMLPAHFVLLPSLPLTPNGKIDRRKLQDPVKAAVGKEYVAPRNEVESKLVDMWQEILARDKIGVHDNFFELGGHSLKVVQLISRISATWMVRINIQSIFEESTVENLAEQIIFILDQQTQKQSESQLIEIDL